MLTTRGNFHHSKLPPIGAIVTVHVDRELMLRHRWRKFRVESYPLCDSAPWCGHYYSLGIHTVNLIALDNGQRVRVSGHYCNTID